MYHQLVITKEEVRIAMSVIKSYLDRSKLYEREFRRPAVNEIPHFLGIFEEMLDNFQKELHEHSDLEGMVYLVLVAELRPNYRTRFN